MTREQAHDILCALQEWRRYDGPIGEGPIMPAPREVGEAIDIAIEVLGSKEVSTIETQNVTAWTVEQLAKKDLRGESRESLSGRALKLLLRHGIDTVWELAGWERFKIMQLEGMGKKNFGEAEAVLKKYGLDWGMWESESFRDFQKHQRW